LEGFASRDTVRPEIGAADLIGLFERLSRPLLGVIDPEDAHNLALRALRMVPQIGLKPDPAQLSVRAFGLNFPNPLGIAPGFDKNAAVPDALLRLGFGFVEVGTVTPRAQAGNPRPRVFRLAADEGVINRLGFNNEGAAAVLARLAERARSNAPGIVGVNVGANRDSIDRIDDYVRLIDTFALVASYFTVNVSSPNTPGLRDLQEAKSLDELLARVVETRDQANRRAGPVPVLLKVAPDLSLSQLDDVVGVARKHRVDGMIVGNTTISRPQSLRDRDRAKETGGLSGRPLFKLSTRMLAETYVRAEGAFPLIGVGGVDSGATAIAKIKAGASLLQLYSGLVYRGLGLVAEIKSDLVAALKRGQRESISSMVGSEAAAITAESWPS
jgi:dihydroorotate dehydrogenase